MATAFDNAWQSVVDYLGYDPYLYRENRRTPISTALKAIAFAGATGVLANKLKNKIFSNNKAMPAKRSYKRSTTRSSKRKQYKRTTPRRRYKRRQRLGPRPKKSTLRKEVKQIKQQLNADSAKHVYKLLASGTMSTAVNQVNYSEVAIVTGTLVEAYMANLRYYDPAVPGTLVTAAGGTGSYQREIFFKNIHSSLEIRNNYQIPVKVKVYLLKPKGDTNIVPSTYYNNSITDQLIGGGSITTKGVYPTDLNAFMAQWSCKCVKDVVLDAGATIVATHNTGKFRYDPSLFDSHSLEYQPKFKACSFFIRLEGLIGHDTAVATEQTTMLGQIDYNQLIRAEINYDAGIPLDDLYVANLHDASFTNGGVVTNKPIADNQALSVA